MAEANLGFLRHWASLHLYLWLLRCIGVLDWWVVSLGFSTPISILPTSSSFGGVNPCLVSRWCSYLECCRVCMGIEDSLHRGWLWGTCFSVMVWCFVECAGDCLLDIDEINTFYLLRAVEAWKFAGNNNKGFSPVNIPK